MRIYQRAVLLHHVITEIEAQVRRTPVHDKVLIADMLIDDLLKDLEKEGRDDEGSLVPF